MRILKPIKSSDSSNHLDGNSDDLTFTVEEIDINQNDGSSGWLNRKKVTPTVKKKRAKGKETDSSSGLLEDEGFIDETLDKTLDKTKKEYNRLFAKGIRLLSMREHSKHEITTKLSVKCDTLDIVHAVVDFLIENKYLSDERFTESYVRYRRNRGFGPNKIRTELNDKGIQKNMIDDYLEANSSIWFENAQNQYKKKYGDDRVKDYNTWAKRARFMQSRGFSMEHIQVTVPSVDRD